MVIIHSLHCLTTLAGLDDATINTGGIPQVNSNKTPVGHLWINSTSGESFVLTDATNNANVWENIGDGTGGVPYNIEYLVLIGGGTGGGRTIMLVVVLVE